MDCHKIVLVLMMVRVKLGVKLPIVVEENVIKEMHIRAIVMVEDVGKKDVCQLNVMEVNAAQMVSHRVDVFLHHAMEQLLQNIQQRHHLHQLKLAQSMDLKPIVLVIQMVLVKLDVRTQFVTVVNVTNDMHLLQHVMEERVGKPVLNMQVVMGTTVRQMASLQMVVFALPVNIQNRKKWCREKGKLI